MNADRGWSVGSSRALTSLIVVPRRTTATWTGPQRMLTTGPSTVLTGFGVGGADATAALGDGAAAVTVARARPPEVPDRGRTGAHGSEGTGELLRRHDRILSVRLEAGGT